MDEKNKLKKKEEPKTEEYDESTDEIENIQEILSRKDIPDEHFDDNGEYVMETDLYDENGAVIRENPNTNRHIEEDGSKNN